MSLGLLRETSPTGDLSGVGRSFERLRRFVYFARVSFYWLMRRDLQLPYVPEYVSIEITNLCNFACAFCPQSDPEHIPRMGASYLAPDQLRILLKRIRAAGVKTSLIHWMLDGEPFMNRRFAQLCQVAVDSGFMQMFFATNGLLATPTRLRGLPREGRYTLKIDYCSDERHFEEVRGTRRSWSRIRDNIVGIMEASDLDHVTVIITDMSSFAFQGGRELRARFAALKSMFPPSPRLSFSTKTFHNAAGFLPQRASERRRRYFVCPYPWATLHVASNGDVVACSRDLERKTTLGNLFIQPLQVIWNGASAQELRRNLRDRRPECSASCAGCDMPYDATKYTLRNIFNTARGRLQLFR